MRSHYIFVEVFWFGPSVESCGAKQFSLNQATKNSNFNMDVDVLILKVTKEV